jgi:hypothetical protein
MKKDDKVEVMALVLGGIILVLFIVEIVTFSLALW